MSAPGSISVKFKPPFYPIVYVRGFAPVIAGGLENTVHDLYYGYAETAVEMRPKAPADTVSVSDRAYLDLFEGQLIRFMKEFAYVDATHGGLDLATVDVPDRPKLDPTRSIWISRFYDVDFVTDTIRPITDHANDLWRLINQEIPQTLENYGVDLGINRSEYRVILVAHSMGGLVCRALMQNVMPGAGVSPDSLIHRLVTIASPHGGIDFGSVPNGFEDFIVKTFNPNDTRMFKEDDMRKYLGLQAQKVPADSSDPYVYKLNSLGELTEPDAQFAFSPQNCFCLIGSDYHSYSAVQKLTGGYSDGLVKQNNAFIDGAYTVNVHRAHSGFRGIVNSFETYENIHRFLFGDTRVEVGLVDVTIPGAVEAGENGFYNLEFSLAIRNAGGVLLHQRRENPCENAIRIPADSFRRDGQPVALQGGVLHNLFMNSRRRLDSNDPFIHFLLSFRIVEHQVQAEKILGMRLWDHEYPERAIYSESVEIRVNTDDVTALRNGTIQNLPNTTVEYTWLSDHSGAWTATGLTPDGTFVIELRDAGSLSGKLLLRPFLWNT